MSDYDDDEYEFGNYDEEDYYIDDMEFGRKKKKKKGRKICKGKKSRRFVMIKGRKRKLYRGRKGALYYRTRRGKTYIKCRRRRKSRFGESAGGQNFGESADGQNFGESAGGQNFGRRATVCGQGQMMNPAWARGKKGARPCIKTKIKVTRSMLQDIAMANGVSIYKLRKDGTPSNVMMSGQGLKYRLTKSGVDWRSQLGIPAVGVGGGGDGGMGPIPMMGPMPMPAGYLGAANPTDFSLDTQFYAGADASPFIASPNYGPLMDYLWKKGKQGSGYYLKKTGGYGPGAGAGPDYVPSGSFIGAQPGYAFRRGPQGQGYYYDD